MQSAETCENTVIATIENRKPRDLLVGERPRVQRNDIRAPGLPAASRRLVADVVSVSPELAKLAASQQPGLPTGELVQCGCAAGG